MSGRLLLVVILFLSSIAAGAQVPYFDKSRDGFLVFHEIKQTVRALSFPGVTRSPAKLMIQS
jgi:hypothetical protein